jgi:ABC-type sugar transport system substrate-binding protein
VNFGSSEHQEGEGLLHEALDEGISRRELVRRAAIAGLSVPAIAWLASAAEAQAGGTARVTIQIPRSLTTQAPLGFTIPKPPTGRRIGMLSPFHADPGQAALDTAVQRVGRLLGWRTDFQDANLDVNAQIQLGDSMLSRGINAIVTDELLPRSLDAFYARAKSRKVRVVTMFSNRAGGVQENDAQAGAEIAAFLAQQFPGGAKGIHFANTPASVILNRERGFRNALRNYPKLSIVLEAPRNLTETIEGARTIAEAFLQTNPEAKWVWTSNDKQAIATGLAARAIGRKLVIIGMNGSIEGVDAVKKGLITATWDSNQNMMGSIAAANAIRWQATGVTPRNQLIPFTLVTKQNAGQWINWNDRPKRTVLA